MRLDISEKPSAPIALFDLDYTLLDGDSEALWGRFLFEKGLVGQDFLEQMTAYYRDYEQGTLDVYQYEAFLLQPLTLHLTENILGLRDEYLDRVHDVVRPALMRRVEWHRQQDHILILITATNNFLAEPIASMLGFSNLICTQIRLERGRFTTNLDGIPAFREGKILLLEKWLDESGNSFKGSWGYSDSHNDLQLLGLVDHAVVVSPDDLLRNYASLRNWEIMEENT
ncbi:MAG TPA: HAD family hydrolase [Anaerolineales bacterium]|nr:HAD family hydrolase [Anaerolineales bacterium]